MRKTLSFAVLGLAAAALAGCNKPAAAPADAGSASAAASESAAPQPAPTPTPGTYEVTGPDGKTANVTTINADGTYTEDDPKGTRIAGIVRFKDGKTCFDPSGAAAEECYTESARGPDGSFTATGADGATVTVRPRTQ